MHADGSLDLDVLRCLVDFHVQEGTDAIVVVGTTGESPTVDVDEHHELIRVVVEHAAGRIPVIAGTGANSTAEAIEMTRFAHEVGADAALSVAPYYNKPTQEGMYRHFRTIAEAVDIPVVLYNVPGRTVADLSNDTALRLAEIPNIVGIKDATGSIDRGSDLIARAPAGFAVYSGDDSSACALMLLGAQGNISVVANVAPRLMHEMCAAALKGDLAQARELNFRLLGLHRNLFCEANPIPVKWACHKLGLIGEGIRLPLTPLSPECHERVSVALRQAGLLDKTYLAFQEFPMKFAVSRLSVSLLSMVVAGCSNIGLESKKIDYKTASATRVPTLEVPPDLTSPTRDDRYLVPDTGGKGSATYSIYAAERTPEAKAQQQGDVLPKVDKVRFERDGSQRWLVVEEKPDLLWDQVKAFWQENGFVIKLEIPEAGIMETDWAENRANIGDDLLRNLLGKVIDSLYSTAERDKFRTRFEPGSKPGTTEVYVSHRGMYETYVTEGKDETRWQPREPDPELEAEMLRRLMVGLGSEQKRAEVEIAAAKIKPLDRARLIRSGDGASMLEVQESFPRAWRRVGLALDRVGFTVEDRDRSKGLYFVRYVDPESDQKKSDGLLSKFAFWKGPAPIPKTQYRIFLNDDSGRTTVQVHSAEGVVDRSETSKKIIGLLYEQLK